MADQLFEKRGNKVIIHVNVFRAKDCPAFNSDKGYVAVAQEMPVCWSMADTMDDTIEKFKKEYGGMLTMQFQNGEEFEFDFAIKLKA